MQKQSGRARIARIKDNDGHVQRDPEEIAEIFALFYEDLYKDGVDSHDSPEVRQASKVTEVTSEELTRALRTLKSGKTGSDDGLVAEMLKTQHGGLIDAIVKLFNSILHDELEVPRAWRETKLKVIFKKGDVELPKNYRPILIIPVLAKLYSSVLYDRMRELIDGQFADEQFGFRKG